MKEIGDTPEWVMGLLKKHPDVRVGEAVRYDDQVVAYRCQRGHRFFYLVYCGYIFSESRIGVAASVIGAATKECANVVACVDKRYYVFSIKDIYDEHPKSDIVGSMPVILIPIHLGVNVNKLRTDNSSQLSMGF